MNSGRYFVYRYDGAVDSDEVELDRYGVIAIPKQGSIVERKDVRWKVATVQVEATESGKTMVPIFRVFLTKA